jgi:hypothetical protein
MCLLIQRGLGHTAYPSTERKQLAQPRIREASRIAFPAGANCDTSTVELLADWHALAQVVEEVKQKHDVRRFVIRGRFGGQADHKTCSIWQEFCRNAGDVP